MTDNNLNFEQSPSIWPGAIEEARSLLGVELRRHDHIWNSAATPDAVRQFAWGTGDENPLFCDPDYGARTKAGTGLAPGCFLYTIDSTIVAPKLRGIQWLYAGTAWEWFVPIRHGDRFTAVSKLIDAEEKRGSHAKAFIVQTGETTYFNQDGALVARAYGKTARTPRSEATGGLKYNARETHKYSDTELVAILDDIHAEKVRGAEIRFWEHVAVGDTLAPVVKGPLNITDMICWYSGAGHTYKAHARADRHRKRHPADAFKDSKTGAQDSAARGHAETEMARKVGMPGGYDVGPQRISWVGQLVTNWMGDEGFLCALDVRISRPNIFGDVSWCRGEVVGKRITADAYLVDLAVKVENQRGEVTASGTAVVALQSRNKDERNRT
jgi:acyl dehydratase